MPVVVGVEMSKRVGIVQRTSAVVVAVVLEILATVGFGKKLEMGL